MSQLARMLTILATGAMLVTTASAQTARESRGASPYEQIENEPPPRFSAQVISGCRNVSTVPLVSCCTRATGAFFS